MTRPETDQRRNSSRLTQGKLENPSSSRARNARFALGEKGKLICLLVAGLLPCPALPCPALPLPCPALPCLTSQSMMYSSPCSQLVSSSVPVRVKNTVKLRAAFSTSTELILSYCTVFQKGAIKNSATCSAHTHTQTHNIPPLLSHLEVARTRTHTSTRTHKQYTNRPSPKSHAHTRTHTRTHTHAP